jgi:hypothetical protein
MSITITHDDIVNNILLEDGREILDDELSSPIFLKLAEGHARLPTFSRRGMFVSKKNKMELSEELNYFYSYRRSSIWICAWQRNVWCRS